MANGLEAAPMEGERVLWRFKCKAPCGLRVSYATDVGQIRGVLRMAISQGDRTLGPLVLLSEIEWRSA